MRTYRVGIVGLGRMGSTICEEIVGYPALDDEDLTIEMDDADETVLEYVDPADPDVTKRARLPKVTVRRR